MTEDIINPVRATAYSPVTAAFRRHDDLGRESEVVEIAIAALCCMSSKSRTATCTAGATHADHLSRDLAVVCRHGRVPNEGGTTLRELALAGIEATSFIRHGARRGSPG